MNSREPTREDQRLLDKALEASTNGVIITDPNQTDNPIVYVNAGFERITGYKQAEVLGHNCRFLQGEDRCQPALTELRTTIRSERPCTVTLRNYRKDGSLFWNELSISPVRDDEGRLTNFVGIQSDITELKRAERHRAVQYGVSRLLAKSSDLDSGAGEILQTLGTMLGWDLAALWMVIPEGNALRCVGTWHAPFLATTGFRVEGRRMRLSKGEGLAGRVWISGKPAWVSGPSPSGALLEESWAAPAGIRTGFGYPLHVGDRGIGAFELFSCRVIRPDRDSVEVMRAVGIQIAQLVERVRAEEALDEIRESERRRIAYDLHDYVLQSMVGALQGLQATQAERVSGREQTAVDLKPETEALRRAVQGLRGAIHDLRSEGEQTFIKGVRSLAELNRQLNPGCEINLAVGKGFPRELSGGVGEDLLRLVQEALANVRRHSGAGDAEISLQTEGEKLRVEISDDGWGFDPDSTDGGIGLSGMRERVAARDGEIEIQSDPGKGTSVRATVPLESG